MTTENLIYTAGSALREVLFEVGLRDNTVYEYVREIIVFSAAVNVPTSMDVLGDYLKTIFEKITNFDAYLSTAIDTCMNFKIFRRRIIPTNKGFEAEYSLARSENLGDCLIDAGFSLTDYDCKMIEEITDNISMPDASDPKEFDLSIPKRYEKFESLGHLSRMELNQASIDVINSAQSVVHIIQTYAATATLGFREAIMNAVDGRNVFVTIIHDKRPPKKSQAEKEWIDCMKRLDEMKFGRKGKIKSIEASLDVEYLNLVSADETKAIFFFRKKLSLSTSEPRLSEDSDMVEFLLSTYFDKYRNKARLGNRLYEIVIAIFQEEKWSIIAGIIGGITGAIFVSPLIGAVLSIVFYILVRISVGLKHS